MDTILQNLNEAQRDAVTSPASILQILAPPGSGKTKTLTSRVAYLLSHHQCKPWNIVCLTFTIKSAREMRERIASIFNDGLEKRLILGTFHSVCRRYLASYGHLVGIPKDFGIADSSDSLSIIKRLVKRHNLNIDPKKAQSRISSTKSRGSSTRAPKGKTDDRNVEQQEFATIFEAYEQQLNKSNLLDYDDLLLRCADLLRSHPSCVSNIEAVLIDEFQDTNHVQFNLMQLFACAQKRITIVGDPDQSIYGWRAAEIKNLKRMQTLYPDTLVINLEENYRSSGAILHAAQEVIEQDDARPQKALAATHGYGTIPVLRKLPSPETEATWIVSEIQRAKALTGGLLEHADFAILLRYAALSRNIEAALGKAGIPYRMVGGQRFFDREEIKVLLGYLRVVTQPSNNDALSYIMDKPPRGAGATMIKSLLEEAESTGVTMWSLLRDAIRGHRKPKTRLSKPAEQGLNALVNVILTIREKVANVSETQSPEDILDCLLRKVDIEGWLKKKHTDDFEGIWANVEELLAQAAQFSTKSDDLAEDEDALPILEDVQQTAINRTEEALSKFLANVALATEIQREDEKGEGEAKPQSRITISTIHAAKGLEWPVVFVPSVYQGSIPLSRAEDHNEERRLLYVAMTRAQGLLFMSYPLMNVQRDETTISSFLESSKVQKALSLKGPSYKVSTVKSIGDILRRSCPHPDAIFEGCSKVESQEDDLWPLTGEEDPEAVEQRWNKGSDSYYAVRTQTSYKKQKLDSSTVSLLGTSTTMQDTSSFTMQSTAGFTTATSHLKVLADQEQQQAEDRTSREAIKSRSKTKAQRGKNSKPLAAGQANLKSMWGTQQSQQASVLALPTPSLTKVQDPPSLPLVQVIEGVSVLDNDLKLPHPDTKTQHRPSLAEIPPNLSSHTLKPFKSFHRPKYIDEQTDGENHHHHHHHPKKPYVFLSSSPTKPSNDEAPSYSSSSHASGGVVTAAVKNDILPASIFHNTSVSQVQHANSIPMGRRTLGVKRSMVGWPASSSSINRGRGLGKSFSVPGRRGG